VSSSSGDSKKFPLGPMVRVSQLFELIDWDLDGHGLTVTDGELLACRIADIFPHLIDDMNEPVESLMQDGHMVDRRPGTEPVDYEGRDR